MNHKRLLLAAVAFVSLGALAALYPMSHLEEYAHDTQSAERRFSSLTHAPSYQDGTGVLQPRSPTLRAQQMSLSNVAEEDGGPPLGLMFVVLGRETSDQEVQQMGAALGGWVEHVLVPQKSLHFAVFYDAAAPATTFERLVQNAGLEVLNASHYTLPRPNRFPVALVPLPLMDDTMDDDTMPVDGSACCYCNSSSGRYLAALEHWLSFRFFHHASTLRYRYVVRTSTFTRFFRRPRFPLFGEMERIGAVVGPVGHRSPRAACSSGMLPSASQQMPKLHLEVSADNNRWVVRHDEGVSVPGMEERFLVMRTAPFRDRHTVDQWSQYTTQHRRHFVEDGWSASHIWALASGGRAANWHWMLWQPRILRKNAVLYFSSETKTIDELKRWTRLRWSRVVREKTDY